MKKMLAATLFALSLCGITTNASAQTSADSISSLDVRGLTAEQKAQLMAQAVELKKQASDPVNASETVRKEAEQWINLGGNMGRAAVAAAKELGVAANDFVETPLGKVTMAVVIYKVMGNELLRVVFGSVLFIATFAVALYFSRRTNYRTVTYQNTPVLWGLFNKKTIVSYEINEYARNDNSTAAKFALGIGLAASALVLLTI